MQARNLKDKRILLTRSRDHLAALDVCVRARGGVPVHLPCLQVELISDAINNVVAQHALYSDVAFTSVNGVHAIAKQTSISLLCHNKRIAAVGKKTAATLQQYGIQVDLVPEHASQDGLIAAYAKFGLPAALLFFRAEQGRETLVKTLEAQDVPVFLALVYRTICPPEDAVDVIAQVKAQTVDAVLLGSPKTAEFYIQRMGSLTLADQPVVVVISESMADAVGRMGLRVQVVAKQASFEAMLDALAEYFDTSLPDRSV